MQVVLIDLMAAFIILIFACLLFSAHILQSCRLHLGGLAGNLMADAIILNFVSSLSLTDPKHHYNNAGCSLGASLAV